MHDGGIGRARGETEPWEVWRGVAVAARGGIE